MKNINSEEYASILKLVQSGVKEDNIIGVSLLVKQFTPEQIYNNFKGEISRVWNKEGPYWFDVGNNTILDFCGETINVYSRNNDESDYLFLTENKQKEKIEL